MTNTFSPEVIQALATARRGVAVFNHITLHDAFKVLDDAGVFAALDEQTDYAAAEDVLAEAALDAVEKELGKPDPAEWGDMTALDVARHQGLV